MAEALKVMTMAERRKILDQCRPVEVAQLVYRYTGLDANRFAADVWEHLRDGFVVATPNYFMMARAVQLDDGRMAWYVTSASGKLSELLKLFPFPLPYIAFNRCGRKRLCVRPFKRFEQLADRNQ